MTASLIVIGIGLLGGGAGIGCLFGWTWGSVRGPRLDRREHYRAQHHLMKGHPQRRARFRRGSNSR